MAVQPRVAMSQVGSVAAHIRDAATIGMRIPFTIGSAPQMESETIGIYSPGAMGCAVARMLKQHGIRPVCALEGRSERTRTLAEQAGLEDVGTLAALAAEADMILSILVPADAVSAAERMAEAMTASGHTPLYVDCNATAAETAVAVGKAIAVCGADYVDASIIGPPPRKTGTTRFYASGPHADRFAALNDFGLEIRVLDGPVGHASAFKTCYASMTKGLNALGGTLLTYAHTLGLQEALSAELNQSQPALLAWLDRALPNVPSKADRFVGEMEEHGLAFDAAGLPGGMMRGAADFYRFAATTPIGQESPEERGERGAFEVGAALADALLKSRKA